MRRGSRLLVLVALAGITFVEPASTQDPTSVLKPPDVVSSSTLTWLLTICGLVGAGLLTAIKVLWTKCEAAASAAVTQQKAHDDLILSKQVAHDAQILAMEQRNSAERVAMFDRHRAELSALRDRIEKEQTDRRADVDRLQNEKVEILRTGMTTFTSVQAALERNEGYVARILDHFDDQEEQT